MPKATKGLLLFGLLRHRLHLFETVSVDLLIGVLVECDPAIKAIIMKIDSVNNDFVTEDLDDQTLLVKESKLKELKQRLEEVNSSTSRRDSTIAEQRIGAGKYSGKA